MADRITNRHLDGLCRVLNGGDVELWTRDEDGRNVATLGAYYIDGAYGGVALYRMCTEGGGVTDVFRSGHMTKRDLYNRILAYIDGLNGAVDYDTQKQIRDALEGDSNDAEHDALVSVAASLGVSWTSPYDDDTEEA